MHIEPQKIDEIKITIKHLEYQVGTCAASLWLDGASWFPFRWSMIICIVWLLSLITLPLLNVSIMWLRRLCNMYQGRGGRRQLCMTRASRQTFNLGCLRARGGYNCLGGAIGWGRGWVMVNSSDVWGGLKSSMGKPQGSFGVNGRDGWHWGPGCVMKGGQGWIRGLSGKIRNGGKSTMFMHWRSWARTGPYIWCFSVVCCFMTS